MTFEVWAPLASRVRLSLAAKVLPLAPREGGWWAPEEELDDVARLYPADHYVMIDDKLRILSAVKKIWGEPPDVLQDEPRSGRVEIWQYADGRVVQLDHKHRVIAVQR